MILTDRSFQIRLALIAIIGITIGFQRSTAAYVQKHLTAVDYHDQQLERLAVIRNHIKPKAPVIVRMPEPRVREYVLEGSSQMSDKFHALINGRVYKTGDAIDEFVVHTITMNSAVLQHSRTGERKILQFTGPQIVQN